MRADLERHWLMRLTARAYVVLVLALLVALAVSLLSGDLLGAALTLAVLLTGFAGTGALVVAIVACLLGGALPAALLGLGLAANKLAGRLGARLVTQAHAASFELEALASATSFPPDLSNPLSRIARGGPITTRAILAAACDADPGRWRPVLGRDPGEQADDGPLLVDADGAECSQHAAEALGVAQVLGERLRHPLDLRLLGVSASLIPSSVAGEWLDDGAVEDLLGATFEQLTKAMIAYAKTAPGADVLRRVEELV